MKIKIKVTKDVLKRSMWCGTDKASSPSVITNCAIAVAVRDVFPNAKATSYELLDRSIGLNIKHSKEVLKFIDLFDNESPQLRPKLPEFEFTIDLPDSVVDAINISDIHKSATLEVVAS